MPIHLPPLNRRRFLAGALATSAGLVLPQSLLAKEPAADPNRFILFADTHVPGQRDLIHAGISPVANLEQAVAEIGRMKTRPAGALIAGDCAFRQGEAKDYLTLRDLIKPLRQCGMPVHLAMGNHDDREHLFQAFPEARVMADIAKEVPDKCISVLETPHANWFLLDSWQRPRVTPGTLGGRQLAWLAKALDARPHKPALVLAHHNPDVRQNIQGLTDTKALFDVLAPRRHVKAYIFGHTHGWHLAQQNGLHLINLTAMVWTFDKSQPSGYAAIHLNAGGAKIRLRALDHNHRKHRELVELAWRA